MFRLNKSWKYLGRNREKNMDGFMIEKMNRQKEKNKDWFCQYLKKEINLNTRIGQ